MSLIMKNAEKTSQILAMAEKGFGTRKFRARLASEESQPLIKPTSRYVGHRVVILTTEDGEAFRTMETWERPAIPPATSKAGEKYFYIDNYYAHRSDKVAAELFGSEEMRWWVLQSNNLVDDEQLVVGLTLRIVRPPSEQLNSLVDRRPV